MRTCKSSSHRRIKCVKYDKTYSGIADILEGVKDLWYRANQPVTRALPVDYLYEYELKRNNSLVQVYICVATAKCYLNLDVLWPLELERKRLAGELDDADEVMDDYERQTEHLAPHFIRTFRMPDDTMHRLFLPLTCAIELCDEVRPARLAYLIADYLADIIPFYATGLLFRLFSITTYGMALLSPFASEIYSGLGIVCLGCSTDE